MSDRKEYFKKYNKTKRKKTPSYIERQLACTSFERNSDEEESEDWNLDPMEGHFSNEDN
jgi:hypothetical protein